MRRVQRRVILPFPRSIQDEPLLRIVRIEGAAIQGYILIAKCQRAIRASYALRAVTLSPASSCNGEVKSSFNRSPSESCESDCI